MEMRLPIANIKVQTKVVLLPTQLYSSPFRLYITMATLHLFPFHVQLLACKLWVAMVIYSKDLLVCTPLIL